MGLNYQTWQVVDAPARQPRPYGIFSVAEIRLPADEHWRLGVEWTTEGCNRALGNLPNCDAFEPLPLPYVQNDDGCTPQRFEPFVAWAMNTYPTVGRPYAERQASAIQRLTYGEEEVVAGYLTQFIIPADPSLTTINLSGYPLGYVLGALEQQLAALYNGTGVIHMNRVTATYLWEYLSVVGGRLQTLLGTPVSVNYENLQANFPPTTNEFQMWGTGPVVIYRSEIDTREDAVDRATNRVNVIAQRSYVVGYDCAAVEVIASYPDFPTT